MASDLDFGSVPQLYLEIYGILCPGDDVTSIDREMYFSVFLLPSGLTRQNLAQIWEISDSTCQGNLKRTGIFKALALIALAQQGKQISEKLILKFSDEELPTPDLGDLKNLKEIYLRLKMQKSNEVFLLNDILALDTVQVTLVPEKKGLFLKHTEYEVTSERYKAVVQRRYNDFVAFHELLLQRFPFRLIPQLPPKKMMGANAEFIEERRKALKRFLNLIARHPTISEDRAVQFFLTFVGTDIQHKIKDYIRNIPEELETNPMDSAIPDGGQVKLHMSREQMRQVQTILYNVRTATKRMAEKSEETGCDVLTIGKELNVLSRSIGSTESLLSLDIGNMTNSSRELSLLYPHFGLISEACCQQAQMEDDEVIEKLDNLLDLLIAYKELGERFDIENNQEPPNPSRPRLMSGRRLTTSPPPSPGSPGGMSDESKQALVSWECRRTFALSSMLSETKLIQAYLGLLPIILYSMVTLKTKWLSKISSMWDQMTPMVEAMKGSSTITTSDSTTNSTLHSPDSPAR